MNPRLRNALPYAAALAITVGGLKASEELHPDQSKDLVADIRVLADEKEITADKVALAVGDRAHFELKKLELLTVLERDGLSSYGGSVLKGYKELGREEDAKRVAGKLAREYEKKADEKKTFHWYGYASLMFREFGDAAKADELHSKTMELGQKEMEHNDYAFSSLVFHAEEWGNQTELYDLLEKGLKNILAEGEYQTAYFFVGSRLRLLPEELLGMIVAQKYIDSENIVDLILRDNFPAVQLAADSPLREKLSTFIGQSTHTYDYLRKIGFTQEECYAYEEAHKVKTPPAPQIEFPVEHNSVVAQNAELPRVEKEQPVVKYSLPPPPTEADYIVAAQQATAEGNDLRAYDIYKRLKDIKSMQAVGRKLIASHVQHESFNSAATVAREIGDEVAWRSYKRQHADAMASNPYGLKYFAFETYMELGEKALAREMVMQNAVQKADRPYGDTLCESRWSDTTCLETYATAFNSEDEMIAAVGAKYEEIGACGAVHRWDERTDGRYPQGVARCTLQSVHKDLKSVVSSPSLDRLIQEEFDGKLGQHARRPHGERVSQVHEALEQVDALLTRMQKAS